MKYQALIFDIDGTAIINDPNALPTPVVKKAVKSAQKNLKVMCATGRALSMAQPIIESLELTEPCVISGGTQLYDPVKKSIIWQKSLQPATVKSIMDVFRSTDYEIAINDEAVGQPARSRSIPSQVYVMYAMHLTIDQSEKYLPHLAQISEIVSHAVKSWKGEDFVDIHITHKNGTKQSAIEALLEQLKLDKTKVIGVGDGSNDLPLFNAVGFKIAMGNASDKLKQAADYVTLPADEDGLASAIDRFVLAK